MPYKGHFENHTKNASGFKRTRTMRFIIEKPPVSLPSFQIGEIKTGLIKLFIQFDGTNMRY